MMTLNSFGLFLRVLKKRLQAILIFLLYVYDTDHATAYANYFLLKKKTIGSIKKRLRESGSNPTYGLNSFTMLTVAHL